jgi:hypothetical protein
MGFMTLIRLSLRRALLPRRLLQQLQAEAEMMLQVTEQPSPATSRRILVLSNARIARILMAQPLATTQLCWLILK